MQITLSRYLLKIISQNKIYLIGLLLCSVLASICAIKYQYQIKHMLDDLSKNKDAIYTNLLIFVAFKAGYHVMYLVQKVLNIIYKPKLIQDITENMYKKTVKHSLNWFDSKMSGEISGKINGFVRSLTHIITSYSRFFACFVTVVVQFFVLYSINIRIFFVQIGFALIYAPITYFMAKWQMRLQEIYETKNQEATGIINDSVANIFGVKVIGNIINEFKIKLSPKIIDRALWDKKTRICDFVVDFITSSMIILIFAIQGFNLIHLLQNGQISIGDFSVCIMFLITMQWELYMLLDLFLFQISENIGIIKASYAFVNQSYDTQDKENATKLQNPTGKLSFKNVCFKYNKNGENIIDNFTLEIKSGEKIGIVGKSGAGKSTIIKSLLRYFDVDSGDIKIDDKSIYEITQDSLRESLSIIPQDITMFHRSIYENLIIANHNATKEEIVEACKKAHIHEDIMNMPQQYDSIVGERGIKLSGGQKQRVAIARAILKNTKILILDEATSSLDSQTENEIQHAMQNFMIDDQKTVIAIAHRLSTIKNMDKIIVIDNGKIVQSGTHSELFSKDAELYKQLWMIQNN